jgi:hypothetical protein
VTPAPFSQSNAPTSAAPRAPFGGLQVASAGVLSFKNPIAVLAAQFGVPPSGSQARLSAGLPVPRNFELNADLATLGHFHSREWPPQRVSTLGEKHRVVLRISLARRSSVVLLAQSHAPSWTTAWGRAPLLSFGLAHQNGSRWSPIITRKAVGRVPPPAANSWKPSMWSRCPILGVGSHCRRARQTVGHTGISAPPDRRRNTLRRGC